MCDSTTLSGRTHTLCMIHVNAAVMTTRLPQPIYLTEDSFSGISRAEPHTIHILQKPLHCTASSKERLAGDDANPHNSEPYERHNSLSFMRVNRGSHAQHTCAHPVAAGWPCARSMRINCQIGRLLRGLALDATNHIVIELKLRPYKRVRLLFAVLAG